MKNFILLFILMLTHTTAFSQSERDYQTKWCNSKNGLIEHVLIDKTRVDCLTKSHAIEFDFAKKWAESIGQSLHYAMHTGKRAGIMIIIIDKYSMRKWCQLNATILHYNLPIDTCVLIDFKPFKPSCNHKCNLL